MKNIAIILIVIGGIALAYQGFTYNKKHTARVGDLSISATTPERVNIPPYVGFIVLGVGVGMLFFSKKSAR